MKRSGEICSNDLQMMKRVIFVYFLHFFANLRNNAIYN